MLFIRSLTPVALIAALAFAAAGCSGDSKTGDSKTEADKGKDKSNKDPVYPVEGTVLFQGTPLPNAIVNFIPDGDLPYPTNSDANGKYILARLPAGNYKVTVTMGPDAPIGVAKESAPTKDRPTGPKGVKLPENYGSKDKTPLSKKIEAGQNTYDIDLK